MFRKSRLGLRHAALGLLVFGAAYACFPHAPAPQQTSFDTAAFVASAAPSDNPARDIMASGAESSLKSAFDATPAEPGYSYAPRSEEAAAPKPVVVPAAETQSRIAGQIKGIQDGITKILEAGAADADAAAAAQKHVAVSKGDTLMDILVKNNIPREEAYNAIQALSKVYDPRDLNPGRDITVFFHRDPSLADAKFAGLRIEKDSVNSVVVNRAEDGSFKVNEEAKTVHAETRAFHGKISNSLYVDAQAQGVPDKIILDLIKMYSWGVDFQREIQPGDSFDVMYEQSVTDDGTTVPGKDHITYARLALGDRVMPLYFYEDRAGDGDFFDPTGQSAKKPLMKTPIDGARISSGFGMRFHPILGYSKMHKGIDFAAPRGTPIYAAGDGVIERAGRFSSYGNYVRIRHRAGLETAYAHMNGFHAGIHPGTRVHQGQVIGYVGTTGRSTGPHLHYEILMNGSQVNPAKVKIAGGRALGGKDLKAFKGLVSRLDKAFVAALTKSAVPAVASAAGK